MLVGAGTGLGGMASVTRGMTSTTPNRANPTLEKENNYLQNELIAGEENDVLCILPDQIASTQLACRERNEPWEGCEVDQ